MVVDEGLPIPPRYWWLKRIIIASVGLIVALVALRLWWGWYASRMLLAEIDRIIAAGEPIYPEDFDPKEEIPDDPNAALLYQKAKSTLTLSAEENQLVEDLIAGTKKVEDHIDAARTLFERNKEVADLIINAKNRPQVDWGVRLRTPVFNSGTPDFSDYRQLAKFLGVRAMYFSHLKKDASAIESLQGLVGLGDAISYRPTLMGRLVSVFLINLASLRVETMAPNLFLDQGTDNSRPEALMRKQVYTLVAQLLNFDSEEAISRAMLAERMHKLDFHRCIIDGSLNTAGRTPNWFQGLVFLPIAPLFIQDALWGVKADSAYCIAARESGFPQARAKMPMIRGNWERTALDRLLHPLGETIFDPWDRLFELHYRQLALRRMAALSLAIQLYKLDHGVSPERIEELVPDYLNEVPLDPFAEDGGIIKYLPHSDPPLLYSVGSDGVDNSGEYEFRKNGGIHMDLLDLVFFLDGNRPSSAIEKEPPAPQSLPQAKEDDEGVEEERGEEDDHKKSEESPEKGYEKGDPDRA